MPLNSYHSDEMEMDFVVKGVYSKLRVSKTSTSIWPTFIKRPPSSEELVMAVKPVTPQLKTWWSAISLKTKGSSKITLAGSRTLSSLQEEMLPHRSNKLMGLLLISLTTSTPRRFSLFTLWAQNKMKCSRWPPNTNLIQLSETSHLDSGTTLNLQ